MEIIIIRPLKNHFYDTFYKPTWYTIAIVQNRRVIGISGSRIWSKTMMDWYLTHVVIFGEVQKGPVSQIHSPHLYVGVPGIISLLTSIQFLKREWGAESIGKLPHLFSPGKTAALIPEFAVEDLPSAELQPRFLHLQRRICPWAEYWWWLNYRPNWKNQLIGVPFRASENMVTLHNTVTLSIKTSSLFS